MAYGKIFESLYTGSMVGSGIHVFAVWSYCIANAKPPGTVELNPKLMAAIFGCPQTEVEDAIRKLCDPDPASRTMEHDGRRLIHEGAYLYSLPTWEKYNAMRNEIERREANREYQRRWREKSSASVSKRKQNKPPSAHVDVDADIEVKNCVTFEAFWSAFDKKVAKPDAMKAWERLDPDEALATAIIEKAKAYAFATPDKAFRAHPATWLNRRGWEDELPSAPQPKASPRLIVSSTQHIPNMPLGAASCQCQGCVEFRAKRSIQ